MIAPRNQAASLLIALLVACSSSDDDAPGTARDGGRDDGGAADGGASTLPVTGTFELTLVPAVPASGDLPETPAFASLLGRAYAGEVPSAIVWTMTSEEGDCQLFEPSVPFCDPGCTGGDVCVSEGRCAAHPRALDLGTVTLRGLTREGGGSEPVAIEPLPPSHSYQLPGRVRLEFPPFAEGADVTLETEGGELAPFAITAQGIAPLELLGADPLRFAADSPTELQWTPGASAGSRIVVRVDISHHGGQKGEIVCDTEDDGSLEIPQALGAELIDLGIAGYPALTVTREASAETSVAGGSVAFKLASPVTRELDIPGLVSCDEPGVQDVCPDGQICQQDRRCE